MENSNFTSKNPPIGLINRNSRNAIITDSNLSLNSVDSTIVVKRRDKTQLTNGGYSNRDSIVSVKHYDSLICELRCPGCAKPFQSPIKLCETGHSVCNLCTKILDNCPICKVKRN